MTNDPSESVCSFEWFDDAIPRYESFVTVDEHRERDRTLDANYGHVECESHGESAGGETLWTVTVGDGNRCALLFGAPHPNEPIGSMTIDFLLHELATNDELRSSLDYEFVCMPVADPDGVRLNEGWFDGPFTLSNYAQNFCRTPPDEQVEATFPVEREEYSFDEPTPETRVLMDLIETRRPEFIYSFHNAAFGGCYYYLSERLEALYDPLSSLPREYDVPLHRGEPEWFTATEFDEAIYRLLTFEDQFDDVRNHDDIDPEEVLLGGNSYDYASRFDEDVIELVVELPHFHDPQIQDQTELGRTRADVIRAGAQNRQTLLNEMRDGVESVAKYLPDTPMAREAEEAIYHFEDELESKLEWAESAPETNEPATVATHIDERYLRQYHLLTYLGMLLRSIDRAAMSADETARKTLVETKSSLEAVFHERLNEIRDSLDYETIPIWKLVAIQARAGLICLDYLQNHRTE
ncbi:peptidase M14 carboxypeptidase A [Halostagnicola larsenii XH-48]|uniref:Peptidase M14 carboxypeptidase A n=1 Tax=Halostagnicola larsenii XH-48 TaxID=797299 RepID=W0JK30_9EURY|nr:M14 family zinc carboxypeptidase [Halostagnicola larsenii]AHF99105.1 peptidase M14 carboxypeptidase A [Halostagnicola larsenii XH-48]